MKRIRKLGSAGIAELKAKLSSYLRRVKSGEEIEILERGVPVAVLHPVRRGSPLEITPPRSDPARLARYDFSVHPNKAFDAVELILEDRRRR
jgi:prevent-host-death family protein